ncbi:2-hydroxychromene-2-carboxylate isomerase [Luteibacter anthropi]|uniref:2-hydroxychromene-2-carboxylate isomerase n=1 Tax=Luteibacter anthropi TaxID=564369 RepID=UPI0020323A8C|nr:2-hydroxychromene-2-carboxylate isomerase [Luteibacter anthropi]URX63949.1 2-hydroxychromene-2-carboxylate isomerase [Luteibacter anthropi]
MIEFWFDFGSNYSYLSVMRIETLARRHGVDITWRPFLLGPIFQSLGWESSPFVSQDLKRQYVWRDMARRCELYDLPWSVPSVFPRRSILTARVALVGAQQPWIAAFSREVMKLNFAADEDIDSADTLARVLDRLGLPAQAILDEAVSTANKDKLREQTNRAAARGIFGAPTFFVGDEMFWGDDRLDDAMAFALKHRSATIRF